MPVSQLRDLASRILVQEATPIEQNGCNGSFCTSGSELPNRVKGKSESVSKLNSAYSNDPATILLLNQRSESLHIAFPRIRVFLSIRLSLP